MLFPLTSELNYLPLGNPEFSDLREKNKIYVDKTELIYKIASQDTPIFFSRPRRFGKSLLINTLHSLFESGLKHFYGLGIEKKWNDKIYKVVHLDFSSLASKNVRDFKYALSVKIVEEFLDNSDIIDVNAPRMMYPDLVFGKIAKKINNNSIVLLVDEYDAPLTHHIDSPDEMMSIMNVLNDFFAAVKQYTGKFRLIFISGITRTSHVSIFSAFNNLLDLSLDGEFSDLLGFTQDDLERYFDLYVENAAHVLMFSKNEVYERLEQYYDGYQFSLEAKKTLYNPWSILSFFKRSRNGFGEYWFETGGMSSIIEKYIKMDSLNLFKCEDCEILVDKKALSNRYEIENIPIEILLFQTGYLSIKRVTSNVARLIFPNTEVEDAMLRLYLIANNLKLTLKTKLQSDELYKFVDRRDLLQIISVFNGILNDCVSILSPAFESERMIRDMIYAALPQDIYLQKIKERQTALGFSDLELLTKKTHMVIEFKRTTAKRDAIASLQEAVLQMKHKKYGLGAFSNLELYQVAMVVSTKDKMILPDFCLEVL